MLGLALGLLLVPPASAAPSLGQVVSPGAAVDGVPVPSGTTLLSPAQVDTKGRQAILHLTNGRALAVDRNSSVRLESSSPNEVRLTVDAGAVSFRETSGEVITLAEASGLLLDAQGQVREGTPVTTVRLCRLADPQASFEACTASPDAAAECEWEVLQVAESAVYDYLGVVAVRAGTDQNDLGLDETCEDERAAAAPAPPAAGQAAAAPAPPAAGRGLAGLSTAAKVGLALGVAAAAYVIIEEVDDDDDEQPASPVVP
ncbi:MAG TPA: hypothetical protein VMR44_10030 [Thermoanaerobaculia bacterium]|nr:hypothetical protein [Thermoanaerobaculia bacterium]